MGGQYVALMAACATLVCTHTPLPIRREVSKVDTEPLTLPSGETVEVRGLTGMEVALIAKQNGLTRDDPDAPGGTAIQLGFVLGGHKRVRDAEVYGVRWLHEHSAADFTTVADAIEARSGYGQGAQKSAVDRATDD